MKGFGRRIEQVNSDYARGLPIKISIKRFKLCLGELTEKGWKKDYQLL